MLRTKAPIRFIGARWIHTLLTILAFAAAGCAGGESNASGDRSEMATGGSYSDAEVSGSPVEKSETPRILFFGDSITAGYGLDPEQAFPALIQERIDDLGWPFEAVNGGLSGETTAGGLRRIDWMLREPVDVFVLELGGNDGLRGIQPGATRSNLKKIVERVRSSNPDASVILAGMRIPPNLGAFAKQFAEIYPDVAEETGAVLIPFIGENVIGERGLLQMDGVHPTAAGHKVLAETVWEYLEPVLRQRLEDREGA